MYDIEVTVNNQIFTAQLQKPLDSVEEFSVNIILQGVIEFDTPISATNTISIKWPTALFPYASNPLNVIFEVDEQVCFHTGITIDMDTNTVTYTVDIDNPFSKLSINVLGYPLSNTIFDFKIPRVYLINETDGEVYTVFDFNFPHSYENGVVFGIDSANAFVFRCVELLPKQISIQPILWYFWNLVMSREFEYNFLYEDIQW